LHRPLSSVEARYRFRGSGSSGSRWEWVGVGLAAAGESFGLGFADFVGGAACVEEAADGSFGTCIFGFSFHVF
jgi:hypothetical protein